MLRHRGVHQPGASHLVCLELHLQEALSDSEEHLDTGRQNLSLRDRGIVNITRTHHALTQVVKQ